MNWKHENLTNFTFRSSRRKAVDSFTHKQHEEEGEIAQHFKSNLRDYYTWSDPIFICLNSNTSCYVGTHPEVFIYIIVVIETCFFPLNKNERRDSEHDESWRKEWDKSWRFSSSFQRQHLAQKRRRRKVFWKNVRQMCTGWMEKKQKRKTQNKRRKHKSSSSWWRETLWELKGRRRW